MISKVIHWFPKQQLVNIMDIIGYSSFCKHRIKSSSSKICYSLDFFRLNLHQGMKRKPLRLYVIFIWHLRTCRYSTTAASTWCYRNVCQEFWTIKAKPGTGLVENVSVLEAFLGGHRSSLPGSRSPGSFLWGDGMSAPHSRIPKLQPLGKFCSRFSKWTSIICKIQ